jgi:phosphate uptake regulator
VARHPATYEILVAMADTALAQFRSALTAWSSQDLAVADDLARSGHVMDMANERLARELLLLAGPDAVPAALHSLVIGKALDRIADHAAIIGCRVRYLITGDPEHLAAELR